MALPASRDRGLAKAAAFIMVMITISRLTGFVRDVISARAFGQTHATDAYTAAFTIPDLMFKLLIGGALSSAFIPVFSGYLAKEKEEEGWIAASTFINVTLILLVAFTIFGIIMAPALAPLVAYKLEGETRILLIKLMRFMFPAVCLTAMAGLQMGILNSYRDFVSPTLGPIVYNLGIIAGTLLLGHRYGVVGMAVGVVAGALGNVLIQLPRVISHNKGYQFRIDLSNPGYRKMIGLMLPAVIGLSVTQVNVIVNQNLASGLAEGSITALRNANLLMQLPLGIFAMGIAQALFPTMSRHAAKGELIALGSTVESGLRTIVFVTLPASVGLIVLRTPIVKTLFEKGAFTAAATHATASALLFYSLGLVSASSIQLLVRAFYSLQDTSTPVKTGVAMVILNFLMNMAFLRFTNLGHTGLALAFAIDSTINMALLLYILNGKIRGFSGRNVVISLVKGLGASILMGVAVFGVYTLSSHLVSSGAVRLLLSVSTGVLVYGLAALLLKMEELQFCLNIVRRRRAPSGA